MNLTLQNMLRDVTRLTQAGQLSAATQAIQRALRGDASSAVAAQTSEIGAVDALGDGVVDEAEFASVATPSVVRARSAGQGAFVRGSHTHASLTREYKLYVPPGPFERRLPLIVMLHGCTQDVDDFAVGTGMNALADKQGFVVLYPEQAKDANPARCWNWFKHNHQARERGETAVIATMTQAVIRAHNIDPDRVYVAGLSAGGAMASLVAAAYPDLFAAVGVHSGLAPGAARSLPEGLSAMSGGTGGHALAKAMNPGGPATAMSPSATILSVPAIVFHGDQDQTVHPRNGEQVIDAALKGTSRPGAAANGRPVVELGSSSRGRRYTRTLYGPQAGPAIAEHWLLHGTGHAWSGGQAAGSYTDARGPDASSQMLRFFLSHTRRVGRAL
jgi:poly(hydroxyalkanoate) depolymerase family esterase